MVRPWAPEQWVSSLTDVTLKNPRFVFKRGFLFGLFYEGLFFMIKKLENMKKMLAKIFSYGIKYLVLAMRA